MGAVRTRSNDDDGGKNKASEAKWQTFHPLEVLRGWESSKDAVAINHSHFQWGETTPVRPLITCQDSSIHNISSNGQFFSKDRLLFIGFLFSGQYGATQLQQLGRLLGSNGNFAFQTKERLTYLIRSIYSLKGTTWNSRTSFDSSDRSGPNC